MLRQLWAAAEPSTSGRGDAGGAAAAPLPRFAPPSHVHPIVQHGCTVGFFGVVATIAVGAYGSVTRRRELYGTMLRLRLVLVGTTLGLYTTGTGFLPVPGPVEAVFGPPTRPPLQV